MTSRAHVEYDPRWDGIRAAVIRRTPDGPAHGWVVWGQGFHHATPGEALTELPADGWLHLQEEDARALYEALADYYGHGVANGRQARADLDHERRRVDKMLDAILPAIGSGQPGPPGPPGATGPMGPMGHPA